MSDYRAGDYFVVDTAGFVGWAIRLITRSRYSHAGIITDAAGHTVEAEARGAAQGTVTAYVGRPLLIGTPVPLTDTTRQAICTQAEKLLGTPYNFLDLLAIGLLQFGVRWRVIRRRVRRPDRLICSQLVDLAYRRAGVPLFRDGRPPQDVTPGALADLLEGAHAPMSPRKNLVADVTKYESLLLGVIHLTNLGILADYLGAFGPRIGAVLPVVSVVVTSVATIVSLLLKGGAVWPTSRAAVATDLHVAEHLGPQLIADVTHAVTATKNAAVSESAKASHDAAVTKAATAQTQANEAAATAAVAAADAAAKAAAAATAQAATG